MGLHGRGELLVGGDEQIERFVEFDIRHFVGFDVDPGEDGLVQHPASLIRRPRVEVAGTFEHRHRRLNVLQHLDELPLGVLQPGRHRSTTPGDAVHPPLHDIAWQRSVCSHIDQVLLLKVELADVLSQLGVQRSGRSLVPFDRLPKPTTRSLEKVLAQLQAIPVPFDRVFHPLHLHVRCVAEVLLPEAAEEVVVTSSAPSDVVDDDATVGAILAVATPAVERALQVVVMHALALPRRPHRHDLLNSREEVAVHQRFVTTGIDLVFETGQAEVVRVLQEAKELIVGKLLRGPSAGGSRLKPSQEQLVAQLGDAVLPGRVELECELDEVSAIRIEVDCSHLSVLDAYPDVDVSERCHEDGAALLRFLAQLVRDVGAVLRGSVLVEGGQDALHELAHRAAVNALRG